MKPNLNNNQELITGRKQNKNNINNNNNENSNVNSINITKKQSRKIPTDNENKKSDNNMNNNNNDNIFLYNNNNVSLNNNSLNNLSEDSNYLKEIENVSKTAPILNLEILNSLTIPKNFIIKIGPFGMISNSLRNKKDGVVYFGFILPENDNLNSSIDFLIKPKDSNSYEERFVGRHFQIKFSPYELKYYIKDLGSGFGTFIKLLKEMQLKDNYLINLGNSYIVCTFGDDFKTDAVDNNNPFENNKDSVLNIKVFSGNSNNNVVSCNPNEIKQIFIGREEDCDIVIDDSLLSRVHCTVYFKENGGWFIHDGKFVLDAENEAESLCKHSTNGTWLYVIEDTLIENNMIFKANQNLYQCEYVYNETYY
jgi:pSer/pThr/pTyr-binding forkhead associated (FHA) protein